MDIPFGHKTTALFELFKKYNATFTGFGGYYMPVSFKGIVVEHQAVRENVGLFDISHMGEIFLNGLEASAFLNYVSTNNINKINAHQMQYHIITNPEGGVVDDLMAYKFSEDKILLVCNASNQDVLFAHLTNVLSEVKMDLTIDNEGDKYSAISIQGPKSLELLKDYIDGVDMEFMTFKELGPFLVSRSGYTGEDGFEVYGDHKDIVKLTEQLLTVAEPCGLGARDTLRFEAGLPLYGHELNTFITPIQAGLNFAIDFEKTDFIGKEALLKEKAALENKVFGMILLDRGIARQGYPIYDQDEMIGYVTSGFMIPGTKDSYANGLIKSNYKMGDIVTIEIRNKRVEARLRKKSYIKKKYAR